MRMSYPVAGLIVLVVLALMIGVDAHYENKAECEDSGGVYVRHGYGKYRHFECER